MCCWVLQTGVQACTPLRDLLLGPGPGNKAAMVSALLGSRECVTMQVCSHSHPHSLLPPTQSPITYTVSLTLQMWFSQKPSQLLWDGEGVMCLGGHFQELQAVSDVLNTVTCLPKRGECSRVLAGSGSSVSDVCNTSLACCRRCGDCRRAVPVVEAGVAARGGSLLEVWVGPRAVWKDPQHPWR